MTGSRRLQRRLTGPWQLTLILLAASILALHDPALATRLKQFRAEQTRAVLDTTLT